jgi:mannosyltransferase
VLAAFFLRLFRLGHQSLWVDEVLTWKAAHPFLPYGWADLVDDTHGPLISALVHGWMRLFGDSEFSLRLPMALATVALVPAVAFLARRAAGNRAFLPAAWLTALSPFVTWYGQELRNYAFAMLWAALALSAALAYRASGRARDLGWLALWTALGALTNLNALLLVPVTFGALVVRPPPGRRDFGLPLVALVALGLVLSPWALRYLHVLELHRLVPGREALPQEEPLRGATTFTSPAIPYTFYAFSVGYSLGPSLRVLHEHPTFAALRPHLPAVAATGILFGALAASGVWALRRRRFALGLLLGALLVPLAAVTYFALMNFKTFNPRYVAIGLPAWLVLIAAGYAAWPRRARLVGAAATGLLFALALAHHFGDPEYGKEDYRAATHALAEHMAAGDSVVVAGGFTPIDYYARRLPYRVYWLGYARDGRMAPRFERFVNRSGGATWVVVSRPEDLDPGGRFEPWLVATYDPQVTTLSGVRVYRIAGPAAPAAGARP